MQRPFILLALLLAGGTAGYFQLRQVYLAQQEAFEGQLREVRAEMKQVQQRARLSEAVALLGTVLVRAELKDYAKASERSARFFDAVQRIQTETEEGKLKQALTKTLARRDEIVGDLEASRATAIPKLGEIHSNLEDLLD